MIRNLPSVSSLSSSDSVALDSASLGADAKATISTLTTYLQSQLNATGGFVSAYLTPATGFSTTVSPPVPGENVALLLTPAGTLATGTVVLPSAPAHGQEISVSTTNTITALTVSGNGYTVSGAPTTMGAATPWRVRFDGVLNLWFKAG